MGKKYAVPSIARASDSFVQGTKTVTTAGTRVALASSTAIQCVNIRAKRANTGIIYVGDANVSSSALWAELYAGEEAYIEVDDLALIYLDSSVSGEGVWFGYLSDTW